MASIRHAALAAVATLLAAGAAVNCGSSASTNPPPSAAPAASATDDDDGAAAALTEYHRHHHHGGVSLLLAMSADLIGITPDQKTTIEQIRTDLHTALEPSRLAEQSLTSALADGIAAGSIDQAKVDAAIAQLTTAAGGIHDASVAALNKLHAILTAPQRGAFVDKVQAHWDVWQAANALEDPPGQSKADADRLARLGDDLGLAPDQADKIRAALAAAPKPPAPLDTKAISAHIQEFGAAFRAEQFDAATLTTVSGSDARMAAWGATNMARFFEAATPVLTADQRAKLAEMLREHASHDPTASTGQGA